MHQVLVPWDWLDIYLLYIPKRILFANNFLCEAVNCIDALRIVSQSCCTHTQVTGTLRLVSCAQQSGQFSGIKLDDNEADSQCERRSSLTRSSTDHESCFHKGRTCKKVKPCPEGLLAPISPVLFVKSSYDPPVHLT